MSIQVRSNDAMMAAPAAAAPVAEVDEKVSAPEAEATEQKDASESDPEEAEVKEDAEAEGSDEETEAKEEAKDKPKKKGGFQRRIDKLNARIAAREQELEYWRQQAISKKDADEPKPVKADSKPKDASGKPDPDNFDTHAEYVEALTDWKTEQKLIEREAKAQRKALETEQQKLIRAHTERVKSFAEKTEDFVDVLSEVDDIPVSAAVQELIVSSDNGPELMYELAKNREEYKRICSLSPLAAARELVKLETRVLGKTSEEKKTETKKITTAPRPLAPVGKSTAGAIAKSIDDPGISQAEYERLRREQIKRRQA